MPSTKAETLANLKKVVREIEQAKEFENPVVEEIARLKQKIASLEAQHGIEEKKYIELQQEYKESRKQKKLEEKAIEEAQDELFDAKRKMQQAEIAFEKASNHYNQEKANLHALLKDLEKVEEARLDAKEDLQENEREIVAASADLQSLNRQRADEDVNGQMKELKDVQQVTKQLEREVDIEQKELLHKKHEFAKERMEEFMDTQAL